MKKRSLDIFRDFTSSEKNAGLVLVFCTLLSLLFANANFGNMYTHFWHAKVGLASLNLNLSVEHWINDGLMTVFFLMVGLEIERELYNGELHPLKNALLPIIAAVGGMLVPALIYIAVNCNSGAIKGFGIPMGTDIAFALGVISLAGNRVPVSIKILLTAIAIIDDLGSILIIALFYGSGIQFGYLAVSMGIFVLLLVLNRFKFYSLVPYLLLGVPMWYFMMLSGIHPAISGVLLAFALPFGDGDERSPSIRLQHFLHLPVAFIILPIFTLANTAIPIKGEFLNELFGLPALGIGLGLVLGKPIGILTASFMAVKFKIVNLPEGLKWRDLLAMGCIAGIGFTMSIFITQLAFSEESMVQSSKLMILIASSLAGCVGLFFFFRYRSSSVRNF